MPEIIINKLNLENKEREFLDRLQAHAGILHKVTRLYMEQEADREDLVQEITVQLWRSYDSFNGSSKFSTWMYRVAVNTALTFLRKEKVHARYITYANVPEVADSETCKEQQAQLDIFYKAAYYLNPVEKALIFYFMEGLSHKEIGLQLGISEVNARVKLNRTKEKLQSIIKNMDYES